MCSRSAGTLTSARARRRAPDGVRLAVDRGLDAPPGERPEPGGGSDLAALAGGGDDGPGERVLAVGLDAGDAQDVVLARARRGGDPGDDVGATGEGAGLVEQDGVDRAHALEGEPVLDQDARPGRHGGRQRDHQRDGEAECVRAGDDRDDHRRVTELSEVAEPHHTRKVTMPAAVAT